MQLNPYLTFNGNCEEAFQAYAKILNGTIQAMITHDGTPMSAQVPAEWLKKIMHASMQVGGAVLMGSDAPPDHFQAPAGFSVSINLTDVDEAERVFAALAEGGTVRMPIQSTFWAARFGMLVDRYGIPWMVNCEQPAAA